MEAYFKTDTCKVFHIDNIELLKTIPSNTVHLVYCDVLYNTGLKFTDYTDQLGTPREAVEWYRPRFEEMHRILKDTGSIYIHCDWHLSSYLRLLLDEIFGWQNYKNEIIRQCTNAKNNSKNWGRIYDNILYYTKSDAYTWNEMKEPKIESDLVSQYNKIDPDGERYTTVPLHAKGATKSGETGKDWNSTSHGLITLPAGRHWATAHAEMERLDAAGLIEWSKNGNPRKKLYARDYGDKHIQNIWDLKSIGGDSAFKNVYDTQKPRELMDRIVRASSNEGDIVADFFLGSGVTAEVAVASGRKFIGCDINERSCQLTKERIERLGE
jgi:adenine-specific DNA-methyltransferase